MIGGQHGVATCDEICKDVIARMREAEDLMTNFDVHIIKFDKRDQAKGGWTTQ